MMKKNHKCRYRLVGCTGGVIFCLKWCNFWLIKKKSARKNSFILPLTEK